MASRLPAPELHNAGDATFGRRFAARYAGVGVLTGTPFAAFASVVGVSGRRLDGSPFDGFEPSGLRNIAGRVLDGRVVILRTDVGAAGAALDVLAALDASGHTAGALVYTGAYLAAVGIDGPYTRAARCNLYRLVGWSVEKCTARDLATNRPSGWEREKSRALWSSRVGRHAVAVEPYAHGEHAPAAARAVA